MIRFLIGLVVSLVFTSLSSAEITYRSHAIGTEYSVVLTDEVLAASPEWPDDAENPPLSATKAIRLATGTKDKLVKDSKDYKWQLESASLVPTGERKWHWVVEFNAQFQGGFSTGPGSCLRIVVLMDGKVLEPNEIAAK